MQLILQPMCFILAPFYSSIKNLNAFIIFLDIVLLYFWILFIIFLDIVYYIILYFWILFIIFLDIKYSKYSENIPKRAAAHALVGGYSGDAGESGASRFFPQMHAKADLENESRLLACAAQRRRQRAHSELKHAVDHGKSLGMLITGECDRSFSSPNITCGQRSYHRFLPSRGIVS
jgi:hypothetical protein